MKRIMFGFIVTLCIILSLPNHAYASTVTTLFTYDVIEEDEMNSGKYKTIRDYMANNKGYSVEAYPYMAVQEYRFSSNVQYHVMVSPTRIVCRNSESGYYLDSTEGGNTYVYYMANNSSTVSLVSYNMSIREGQTVRFGSNQTIYLEDGKTVFFYPPLTQLAAIVEESNRRKNPMYQVISLLPLGISLVISFLALRKCLKALRTILSKA